MKRKIFILLLMPLLLQLRCYAQNIKYADIHQYLFAHCQPPDTVVNQCGWQLAMVKLTTNKAGRVISYRFLNPAPDALKSAFKPLLHYQFPPKLNMRNKCFVFAQTYYNLKGKCSTRDLPDVQKVFEITYRCCTQQLQLNPATVFDDVIFTALSDDNVIIDRRPAVPPLPIPQPAGRGPV